MQGSTNRLTPVSPGRVEKPRVKRQNPLSKETEDVPVRHENLGHTDAPRNASRAQNKPGLYHTTHSLHRMWQFDRSLMTLKAHWERARSDLLPQASRAHLLLSAQTGVTLRSGSGTSGASMSHSSGVSARRRMSAIK
jgi:hypothetical protein